jgi:hypothetical protein
MNFLSVAGMIWIAPRGHNPGTNCVPKPLRLRDKS